MQKTFLLQFQTQPTQEDKMTPEQYLVESQKFYNPNHENRIFYCEIGMFSVAGRILETLKGRLNSGIGLDKERFISELGELLFVLGEMSSCTLSSFTFIHCDWSRHKSIVPGGYTGCAVSLLGLLKSHDIERRIQLLSVACSHLGITWEQVSDASIKNLKG